MRSNWDQFRWGMSNSEMAGSYHADSSFPPFVQIPVEQLRSGSPMRNLIKPHTFLLAIGDQNDGLQQVQFATLLDYRQTVARLRQIYGRQVKGPDNEDNCFDSRGNRKDGGSHDDVVRSCMRQAVFLDRRHGNAILVNASGSLIDFRREWHNGDGTIVAIKSLGCWPEDCEDYHSD